MGSQIAQNVEYNAANNMGLSTPPAMSTCSESPGPYPSDVVRDADSYIARPYTISE